MDDFVAFVETMYCVNDFISEVKFLLRDLTLHRHNSFFFQFTPKHIFQLLASDGVVIFILHFNGEMGISSRLKLLRRYEIYLLGRSLLAEKNADDYNGGESQSN